MGKRKIKEKTYFWVTGKSDRKAMKYGNRILYTAWSALLKVFITFMHMLEAMWVHVVQLADLTHHKQKYLYTFKSYQTGTARKADPWAHRKKMTMALQQPHQLAVNKALSCRAPQSIISLSTCLKCPVTLLLQASGVALVWNRPMIPATFGCCRAKGLGTQGTLWSSLG